jgi:hypothetical protein
MVAERWLHAGQRELAIWLPLSILAASRVQFVPELHSAFGPDTFVKWVAGRALERLTEGDPSGDRLADD